MTRHEPISNARLVEALRAFRELGFFRQWAEMSDAEAAELFTADYLARTGRAWDSAEDDDPSDFDVLAQERDRVWWEDCEADMVEGEGFYVKMVQDLAKISRGAFQPDGIEER